MFGALKNRCEMIYFEPYSNADVLNILRFYMPGIELKCNLDELSVACRNRARDTYILAKNIERYCGFKNSKCIESNDWNNIKSLFNIKPMGINSVEFDILNYINIHEPISCSNIASGLMTTEESIKTEFEVRLRELDLICNTSQGRVLTDKGKMYIEGKY
jgi:Holliday junction resolvasome RuvABC ATP-dependent DNA helicase subunit